MALEYSSAGTAVTDEAIVFSSTATINGVSYYMGRVAGLAAPSVAGNTSGSYGVWSGTLLGGQRKEVLLSGVPGSTAEVLWDLQSGRVYSTASTTRYARYFKYADLLNEGRIYQISIPFMVGTTGVDLYVDRCPWKIEVGEYQISCQGNRPTSATLTLQLRTATAGAGTGATLTLGSTESRCSSAFKPIIAGGISFTPSDKIVLRSTSLGNGFEHVNVTLRERLRQL